MINGAANIADLAIGVRIGAQSGLPNTRLAAVRGELNGLKGEYSVLSGFAARNPVEACPGLAGTLQFSQRRMEIGELAALRESRRAGTAATRD
jgi:hypothetical protein